ncbi:MAG: N-acetylglucosamine-6-phosphate deacetylase [Neisseriaceae bacterium]
MHIVSAKYLFDGNNLCENKALLIDNNIVQQVVDINNVDSSNCKYLGDGVITPGFIDLQLNGCGGVLFNDDISESTLETMYQTCLCFGTTSFLPTLITSEVNDIKKALTVINSWMRQHGNLRGVVGIHLEGPFISKQKSGIHNEKCILEPTDELLEYIASFTKKFPIKMTIAPEVFHMEQIKYLHNAGIILSIGHSNASYQVAKMGIDEGITTATHIFNAMSGLTGRNPGVVGAVLNNNIYAGVIADLIHVDSANIELLHKIKGDKLYIVTDAVTPMGTDLIEFEFVGKRIFVDNGKCVDENGVIGGANISMNESVKNCIKRCDIDLKNALKMAVSTPARLMKLTDKLVKINGNPIDKLIYMDLDSFECKSLNQEFK